jgi:Phosphatidylserine/phosphatidylglycerophosphate/cardiolipin synthases and related enzymes
MWDWIYLKLLAPLGEWIHTALALVFTNFIAIIGFLLALMIVRRVFVEKRTPSNFFAWFFIVVFVPIVGVPLYFMFGGRKSRKMTRIKLEITQQARELVEDQLHPNDTSDDDHLRHRGDEVSKGNHFELLPDGEIAFHRICKEIEAAEKSIHIATYILSQDETGKRIIELLEKKASEGVQVRLLVDSLGSWYRTWQARYRIRKAGGEVGMFMPVLPIQTQTSANLRNHRKIAIFDGYRAITGGQNLDTRFMGPTPTPDRFKDFSVVTQGPAVAHLTRTFLADWAFTTKTQPSAYRDQLRYIPEEAGNSTIEIIPSGPDLSTDPLWEQILRIIQEFRQSLTIITPYFIPDEVLYHSLMVKAHTGRHIRLILPLKSNQRLTDIARFSYLEALHKAGVDIRFYTPGMLHGKLILADGKVGMIGSANIDMRSLFVNFEIALLHYTDTDIQQLQKWADDVLSNCIDYPTALKKHNITPNRFLRDLVQLIVPLL